MMLPLFLVVYATAIVALYRSLRRRRNVKGFWQVTLLVGLGVGVGRAGLASLGWYAVERTGGPLQIPAYLLAMIAWPEASLLPRAQVTPVPPAFYLMLSGLLIGSSLLVVMVLAGIARLRQGQKT